MADYPVLLASDVKAGDELPELAVDVSATTVILGALAARDWRPMHHDRDFAQQRNGVKDIFMNTPNLAAWFERYLTDWTGPFGRLGWIRFRMKDSVFPGETMVFNGKVTGVDTDDAGCVWAEVEMELVTGGRLTTVATARIAVPAGEGDNPWKRRGDDWKPQPAA